MTAHVTGLAVAALVLGALAAAPARAQDENTGPNSSILRWAEGTYMYYDAAGERERGVEKFRLNVHPDGTRTMIMWHDLFARNLQYSVMLRVDERFRPLQAFANYWSENGYKGSTFITVSGDTLTAVTNGPNGRVDQELAVPDGLSIGSHPVSGDGWHMWHAASGTSEPQQSGALYGIESSGDLSKPPLGSLTYMPIEVLGPETITVPAGTFETDTYRLAGRTTIWTTGPDRLVVRMSNARFSYVLEELDRGNNAN